MEGKGSLCSLLAVSQHGVQHIICAKRCETVTTETAVGGQRSAEMAVCASKANRERAQMREREREYDDAKFESKLNVRKYQ